eukprot:3793552-Rhodomonas_salina.1
MEAVPAYMEVLQDEWRQCRHKWRPCRYKRRQCQYKRGQCRHKRRQEQHKRRQRRHKRGQLQGKGREGDLGEGRAPGGRGLPCAAPPPDLTSAPPPAGQPTLPHVPY